MGIEEKIAKARKTDWLTKGLSEEEIRSIIESARASARKARRKMNAKTARKNSISK